MAVDEAQNERVRRILGDEGIAEKRMFSGICFLLRGNMLCAVNQQRVMFRVGKEQHDAALQQAGASPLKMRGKTLRGFVWVGRGALVEPRALKRWIAMARRYVETLPEKTVKPGRAPVL